jgi:hypothetical protein
MATNPLIPPGISVIDQDSNSVDAKHSYWNLWSGNWAKIDLLCIGGGDILRNAQTFLVKKPKENGDVYEARCADMTYTNLLGTGVTYYAAQLFGEEWTATFSSVDGSSSKSALPPFYAGFAADVDRSGTGMSPFLQQVFKGALKFGTVWVLTDLPLQGEYKTRADQKAAGADAPYWTMFDPRQVINWDEDEHGVLNWAVTYSVRTERTFKAGIKAIDCWTYYDRMTFQKWEAPRKQQTGQPDTFAATLVTSGPHALAAVNRVPLRRLDIDPDYWIANRAYPAALDHLNLDNRYAWALKMANLPVPYIKGEFDEPPAGSTTELMQIPAGSDFGWTEPKGTSFEHSDRRLASLVEEIYRQMHLQNMGKRASATASSLSGESKREDREASQSILSSYAKWLRNAGRQLLRDVLDARGDTNLSAEISGTDFEEVDLDAALATLDLMTTVDIPSDTLEKVAQTQVALKIARDETEETRQKIKTEIEAAPTRSERAEQQSQLASQQFQQALQQQTDRAATKQLTNEELQGAPED